METIVLKTSDYLKEHSSKEVMGITSLSKKIGKFLDHMMSFAVLLLMVIVLVFAFMKIGESGTINAQYYDAATKIVFAP